MARSDEAADETAVATFAYRIMLNVKRFEKMIENPIEDSRASGGFCGLKKDPHEMGSKKGNVKIRRKIGRPQIICSGSTCVCGFRRLQHFSTRRLWLRTVQ